MRRILFIIPILCLSFLAIGQSLVKTSLKTTTSTSIKKTIKIYPNPAFNFIGLNSISGVGSIIVYNLVGRKMKKFTAQADDRYDITDLPRGIYLVQLLGKDGKVVTTQRMSKK